MVKLCSPTLIPIKNCRLQRLKMCMSTYQKREDDPGGDWTSLKCQLTSSTIIRSQNKEAQTSNLFPCGLCEKQKPILHGSGIGTKRSAEGKIIHTYFCSDCWPLVIQVILKAEWPIKFVYFFSLFFVIVRSYLLLQ